RKFVRSAKGENRLCLAIAKVVFDLACLEENAKRHDRGTGLYDPEIDDRKIWEIRAHQRDVVAAAVAEFYERVGNTVRRLVELAIRHSNRAANDGFVVGRKFCVLRQDRRQV